MENFYLPKAFLKMAGWENASPLGPPVGRRNNREPSLLTCNVVKTFYDTRNLS